MPKTGKTYPDWVRSIGPEVPRSRKRREALPLQTDIKADSRKKISIACRYLYWSDYSRGSPQIRQEESHTDGCNRKGVWIFQSGRDLVSTKLERQPCGYPIAHSRRVSGRENLSAAYRKMGKKESGKTEKRHSIAFYIFQNYLRNR